MYKDQFVVRFGSVRSGSIRFRSVRFGSVPSGSVLFVAVRFGSVGSGRFGWVRLVRIFKYSFQTYFLVSCFYILDTFVRNTDNKQHTIHPLTYSPGIILDNSGI